MSLNMYLGEVQSQTNTMYAFCTATIQSMEQVIQSIDSFVSDSVLQGQTYDSAKMYFAETFLPLAQGIIYLCEELLRQNEAFPAEFQSRVASTDVVEQELLEQIREIDRMIASIEVTKQIMTLPDMDAMVNLFIEMRRKIQEKLEHLYEFNQTSSNNYATAIQLAASIAAGLAEVQSGKGFSPASGTFSTQRINMEWADSIHEYLDNDIRLDNSINTNNLIESGIILGSSSEKNILEKFIKGVWNGSGKFIGGLVETYNSLDDTVTKENLKYAAGHPIETAYTMINTFSDTFMNEFWHGDAESRTQWGTNIFMEFGLGWIGDKGAGQIGKVTSLGDSVKLTKFSGDIPYISSHLPLKDRFAFAGEYNLRSKFGISDLNQALSIYQFAKSNIDLGKISDLLKNNKQKMTDGRTVTPKYSSYEERLKVSNKNHGEWKGDRGESKFISNKEKVKKYLDEIKVDGVEYKNAMPNFSAFSRAEIKIDMTEIRDGKKGNFAKADEALAKKLSTDEMKITRTDIKKWRTENRYTWHELNDCETIQLVPTDINSTFKHFGGVGEIKKKNSLGE
ncbi:MULTISPECIES: HNH endonuclease [Bacillus]|nr:MULTISPECIES: HNH endonuclease [Bacillus]EJS66071.1 hypothetical protein ICW_03777 [Bacillus wiedmannii]EJV66842.1 hypothetical protein IEO_01431 [Bacillus wiedmannii]MDR4942782.1 HNH endonuclease [Bacillus wiedmannii]MED3318806.1 HNH endonuclease [Bacillus wiedmannii]OFD11047.1 Ribonuclease [Bacillus wiedmannii]